MTNQDNKNVNNEKELNNATVLSSNNEKDDTEKEKKEKKSALEEMRKNGLWRWEDIKQVLSLDNSTNKLMYWLHLLIYTFLLISIGWVIISIILDLAMWNVISGLLKVVWILLYKRFVLNPYYHYISSDLYDKTY